MRKTETKLMKIKYNETSLEVATRYRSGSDKLIVFLHGLGCSQEKFRPAFASSFLEDFSILTFDFIGYGKSDKPDGFSYRLEDQAAITALLLNNFSYKSISIVGHSLGGAIGLLAAKELPGLGRFISVEGNLIAKDTSYTSRRTAEQSEEDFVSHGYHAFLSSLSTSRRKDFQAWAASYKIASPLAVHRSACSLVKWSNGGKLLNYFHKLPSAAYIYGDEENQDYLLSKIEGIEQRCVAHSGHFVMVDNPRAFYQAVGELCS